MGDLSNLLIETNEVFKNIIESKNNDDMDIEAILPSIKIILESVIPVINFYTSPELTNVFFKQYSATAELLQEHFKYLVSTKDSPDFDRESLEDYLVNWYYFKIIISKIFFAYVTIMETINNELNNIKAELKAELKLKELYSSGELVGGGFETFLTKFITAILLVDSNMAVAAQATQMAQSSDRFAVQETPQTENYKFLEEKGVTIVPSLYTKPLGASMGAVEASNGAFSALSKAILGDNYGKAMESLLGTVAEVNIANNYICTQATQELSPYFEGPVFDYKKYNEAADEGFAQLLGEVSEVVAKVDTHVVELDGNWGRSLVVSLPEDPERQDLIAEIKEKTKGIEGITISPQEAARFNSELHETVFKIIQKKRKQEQLSKLLEKEKLFELGKLCNERLFSVISEGGEALITIDLHNNAFRTGTYEKIMDSFTSNTGEKTSEQSAQINKLEYLLHVLNPVNLLGTLSGILSQSHRTTPAIMKEVNDMLAKYRDDLNIIRRHGDPESVFKAIKNREETQAEEDARIAQVKFDMRLTEKATKLAAEEAEVLVDSRLSAANNTERSLDALKTKWSVWTSGSVDVVLGPVAAALDKGAGVLTNLAVDVSDRIFGASMSIAARAFISLVVGLGLVVGLKSSPALIRLLSSLIPRLLTTAPNAPNATATPTGAPGAPPPAAAPTPSSPRPGTRATTSAAQAAEPNPVAAARSRQTKFGSYVQYPVPTGPTRTYKFGAPAEPQSVYDIDLTLERKGGKNKRTKKNKRFNKNKRTKKNKRTRKNKRTKKNKRAKKNKSNKK